MNDKTHLNRENKLIIALYYDKSIEHFEEEKGSFWPQIRSSEFVQKHKKKKTETLASGINAIENAIDLLNRNQWERKNHTDWANKKIENQSAFHSAWLQ